MLLGDIIASLEHEENAALALQSLADIVLYAEVREMCDAFGESVGEYLGGAARRFADGAGDEDWLAVVAAVERPRASPTAAALGHMLRWAIRRDRAELAAGPEPAEARACSARCHTGAPHGDT